MSSTKEKQLLFVTHKYPPSTGGMQKQSYELIHHIQQVKTIHTIIYKGNYPKFIFLMIATPWAWIKILKNKNIGLVHANDGLMALFLTPLLSLRKIKICATVHGLDVVFNLRMYQWWIRNYLSRFSFLIAVSEATKKECVKAGIRSEKIHFIPNAVELPDSIQPDPNFKNWLLKNHNVDIEKALIISSVGRPVPRKGFYWFSQKVLPNLPASKYIIVGPELKRRKLISLIQKTVPKNLFEMICKMVGLQLDHLLLSQLKNENVILLGHLTQQQLHQLYLHTDLFVMPNRHVKGDFEGFGLVALEAGSMGAVCLAADVDGIPSAIQHEKNGFLLPSMDANAWIKKIKELKDPKKLNFWRGEFQAYFKKSQNDWRHMSDAYLKVFDSYLD